MNLKELKERIDSIKNKKIKSPYLHGELKGIKETVEALKQPLGYTYYCNYCIKYREIKKLLGLK